MATCENCGVEVPQGEEIALQGQGKGAAPLTICRNCNRTMERTLKAETEDPNLAGAGLLGLGAAVGASFLWYGIAVLTNYKLGIVAVAVGWLVAQAAILGAGRKRGPGVQVLSVAATLIAMAFSEYLIVRHFVVAALATEGYTSIPLLLPLNSTVQLIVEGVKNDPLTLLFWGIALWEAYSLPAARRLARANP